MKKTLISLFFLFLFLFVGIEVFAENNSVTRVINDESENGTDNIPSDAYRMLDFRHYVLDNVTSYIQSYLNNSNSVDHDYYFFTNAANSNVDITIRKTTNENVEITFVLFKLEYIENNNSYTKELTQIDCQSIEYDSNINSVNYNDTIDSGTYYILIFSTDVSVYNSNITYHIDFEMDKIECQSANITQLRLNKGLKGAIWLSELQPMNLDFNEAKGKLVYDKASDEYPEHLLEMIRAEETHLNYATIYIWDDELKYALFRIVSELHHQLEVKIETIQSKRLQLELVYNDITETLEIVGYVLNGLELIPSISAAVEVASGVLDVAGEYIDTVFDAITPDFDYYDFTYITFLGQLMGALDAQVGDYGTDDYTENYDTIIIPLTYELSSNQSNFVMHYTVDYDYSFSSISECAFTYHGNTIPTYGWEKRYNKDKGIYELVVNNDFIRGNIYAITDESDFGNINTFELVSECEDVMPYVNPILLNDGNDGIIPEYGYIWYSFTAPESRIYYVNSYAIDGLDKILVELFETPVAGYSEDEKITEYSSNFALDINYSKTGCCFEIIRVEIWINSIS